MSTTTPALRTEYAVLAAPIGEEFVRLGLPSELAQRWQRFKSPLHLSVAIARDDERLVGVVLCARRTLGEYLKVCGIWTAADSGSADTVGLRTAGLQDGGNAVVGLADSIRASLLERVEREAWDAGAVVVKLEVSDDTGLVAATPGYQQVAAPTMASPHPDPLPAVPGAQFKWREQREPTAVPFVRQTSAFTCGPSSVLMALGYFGAIAGPDRALEFAIWREATMVEACDPYGLALAAANRGLAVELTVTTDDYLLLEEFDDEPSRNARRFLQDQFREQVAAAGIDTNIAAFSADDVRAVIESGRVAILLIDEDPFDQGSCAHWIIAYALAGETFLLHDPWTETSAGETWLDCYDLPVRAEGLEALTAVGDPAYSALLAVGAPLD